MPILFLPELENIQKERGQKMKHVYILFFILFAISIDTGYAEDRKEEIKAMVDKEVVAPTEYEFPAETMKSLQSFQESYSRLGMLIENHKKAIAFMQQKVKTCEANMSHDASSIKHTVRTFLASEGVPLRDLDKWHIVDDKAVRKADKKE